VASNAALKGCQIFHGAAYQDGEKYTKGPLNVPNCHEIYQIAVNKTKWPKYIPTFFGTTALCQTPDCQTPDCQTPECQML
jgi:hypothetical protein